MTFEKDLDNILSDIKDTLMEKNSQYGNSSLSEDSIFNTDRTTQIEARIDDKLSRLGNLSREQHPIQYWDTIKDLLGYLVLYMMALQDEMVGEIQ